jgi:hypothetical protein
MFLRVLEAFKETLKVLPGCSKTSSGKRADGGRQWVYRESVCMLLLLFLLAGPLKPGPSDPGLDLDHGKICSLTG